MQKRQEPFFFWMAVLLIVIIISGFSLLAFQRPGGPMATPLFLHFHGAVFLGWFLLLATQARLIGVGSVDLHKKLGLGSIGLAIAIVIIGYLVVQSAIARPGAIIAGRPAAIGSVFPIADIINFMIVYSLGLLNRGTANAHKRLMLLAGVLMIDPAMARLIIGLGLPGVLILVFEVALLLSLVVYDVTKFRRPHWVSLFGLALYIATFAFKLNIESVSWWPQFVGVLF